MSMVFSSILAAHRRSVTTLIFLALFSLTHAQTPWDGSPDTDWYTSNPSATEYTINTAEELAGLAIIVNNTAGLGATVPFTDKTITLGNNIVLNDVTNWENWATTAPENTWERIGNSSTNIFKGTFDGNGKTISGVYVNSATFEGLFGWLDGTIKDLNVTNSYIKGTTSVGGLVGRINAGSRVINCSFSGNVEGGENTGGLVGLVFANNAVVNQSRSSGSVTGTASSVGGLVGQNGGQIYNSYSSAKVSSTSNQVGGLVGRHAGGASVNIYNSFATGEVTGIDSVGGFVGAAFANTGIANSYSTGRVTATKTVPIATGGFAGFGSGTATLHNCFYDTDKSGQNDKTGKGQGKTTAQMQTQDFVNNLNSFAGIIPIPATQAVEISIKKWNYSTGNYPSFSNENASAVEIKDFFARGTGTVSDPYIINRREHLVNLSMLVSLQIVFRDEYIKLETDIELNDNSADNWENYSSIPPANAWIPIGNNTGTNAKTFNGTFDGNFHTISGVYINVQNTPASGMGLFGNIGTFGTVKNLGLINSYIRVNDTYIGGIAGDNLGTIENCYSNAWVAGNGWLGGIAGRVNGANGKILNSYFGGTVELTGGTSGNAG
ncbi:MAG: hypothetical protein LBB36_06995, partial [Fibromonadaceae bacterium]|nr:hypothetical protein [Fibromonadaceae bacterium]